MNLCEKNTIPTNNDSGLLNFQKLAFLNALKKLFL